MYLFSSDPEYQIYILIMIVFNIQIYEFYWIRLFGLNLSNIFSNPDFGLIKLLLSTSLYLSISER